MRVRVRVRANLDVREERVVEGGGQPGVKQDDVRHLVRVRVGLRARVRVTGQAVRVEHSRSSKPKSHTHVRLGMMHVPCPEQPPGHWTVWSHAGPG